MERGSAKHSARTDDALAKELDGQLQPGGSQREEWAEAEPIEPDPFDPDPIDPGPIEPDPTDPDPTDPGAGDAGPVDDEGPQPGPAGEVPHPSPADMPMRSRLQRDPAVTDDLGPADTVRDV